MFSLEVTLQLQAATVHIYPNKDLSPARHKTQELSLVIATEVACVDVKTKADCFDADTPLCWSLLTSLPMDHADDVHRILRFYALRWRIVGNAFPKGTTAFHPQVGGVRG